MATRAQLAEQAANLLIEVTEAMTVADIKAAIAEVDPGTPYAPKGDAKTLEVEIARGYTPHDLGLLQDDENKLPPGRVVELPIKEAKSLIRSGIAKFSDDDDLGDE